MSSILLLGMAQIGIERQNGISYDYHIRFDLCQIRPQPISVPFYAMKKKIPNISRFEIFEGQTDGFSITPNMYLLYGVDLFGGLCIF